ncbi:hypothetical protein LXL04_024312 [Taraxacum kok-saghyz]
MHHHPLPSQPRWSVAVLVAGTSRTMLNKKKTIRKQGETHQMSKADERGLIPVAQTDETEMKSAGEWRWWLLLPGSCCCSLTTAKTRWMELESPELAWRKWWWTMPAGNKRKRGRRDQTGCNNWEEVDPVARKKKRRKPWEKFSPLVSPLLLWSLLIGLCRRTTSDEGHGEDDEGNDDV